MVPALSGDDSFQVSLKGFCGSALPEKPQSRGPRPQFLGKVAKADLVCTAQFDRNPAMRVSGLGRMDSRTSPLDCLRIASSRSAPAPVCRTHAVGEGPEARTGTHAWHGRALAIIATSPRFAANSPSSFHGPVSKGQAPNSGPANRCSVAVGTRRRGFARFLAQIPAGHRIRHGRTVGFGKRGRE